MSQPLRGALIIEAVSSQCPPALRMAIALAGRMAADLGAQVVTVTDRADAASPQATNGEAPQRTPFLATGKELLELPQGQFDGRWHALQRRALATLEDQHLLGRARMQAPPVRVVLSMFGQGLAAGTAASEFTLMALGGLLDIVGDADAAPLRLGGHQLAYSAGLAAFAGLMAVLGPARGTPAHETVRVNLLDTAVWLNWKSLVAAAHSGTAPSRSGNRSEWRVVPCADGWVALVYRDTDWSRLKALINDPRLEDMRFATQAGRRAHADELATVMDNALLGMRRQEIHQAALASRLPLGPIYSPRELVDDPQNVARGFLQAAPHGPHHGALMPRLPVLWNGQPVRPCVSPPGCATMPAAAAASDARLALAQQP